MPSEFCAATASRSDFQVEFCRARVANGRGREGEGEDDLLHM